MKAKSQHQREQQLMSKLSSVRQISQLKRIYDSVEQQNSTLRQDIISLRYKIDVLAERQKFKHARPTRQEQIKAQQLASSQKVLEDQYKLMQQLKKKSNNEKTNKGSEQLQSRALELANSITVTQKQLAQCNKTLSDLKSQAARLQKTMQQNQQTLNKNQPQLKQVQMQNNLLKKKMMSLKKLSFQKQYEASKVMNSMYTMKGRFTRNEQASIEIKKMSQLKTQKLKSKEDLVDVSSLQRQVQQLKKLVEVTENSQVKKSIISNRRKEQLMDSNRSKMKNLKQMDEKKFRLQMQLNKYKHIWQKHIQFKNNNKLLKQYLATGAQIQEQPQKHPLLRRDFAGILGGKITFDDRFALKDNKKAYMVGFKVWQLQHQASARNLLIAFQAVYDDEEANKNIIVPLPGQYLAKCKLIKYMLVEGDFIKLFKVKYNSNDNHILKIQIRTNKNQKYEFGDKRNFSDMMAGQNVYGFDISINEYPVCLFGSYNNVRSQWYMESLGVQINELP